MSITSWLIDWVFELDYLTDHAERFVYSKIPPLGYFIHLVRFFYNAFIVLFPLTIALAALGGSGIQIYLQKILDIVGLFAQQNVTGAISAALAFLSSYPINALIILTIGQALGGYGNNVLDDYARLDIEKNVTAGYEKRYLSPIRNGKVGKTGIKTTLAILYGLSGLLCIALYFMTEDLFYPLAWIVGIVGGSALVDFYLPNFLVKRLKASGKWTETVCDFMQNYFYILAMCYMAWKIIRPISEMPLYMHLFLNLYYIASYYAFEFHDYDGDRASGQWNLSNIVDNKVVAVAIDWFLYFLLLVLVWTVALFGSLDGAVVFILSPFMFIGWCITCVFLGAVYKKPTRSLHGAYSIIWNIPIVAPIILVFIYG